MPVTYLEGNELAYRLARYSAEARLTQVNDRIFELPGWVAEAGLAVWQPDVGPRRDPWFTLFCTRERGLAAVSSFASRSGQLILDLPPGMWSIVTMDAQAGNRIAVETVRGSPVICGLYSPCDAVVLVLEKIAD